MQSRYSNALQYMNMANNMLYSFSETRGIPVEQSSDTYYFPAYNNLSLSGQPRFGVP